MLSTFPSSEALASEAAAAVAGAAASVAAASLLPVSAEVLYPLFLLVFAAFLPPHPAIMVTSIAVHNNVLTIFFFIENPPP